MARRLTTLPTVAAKRTHDPHHQPCFALYTMHYSHGGGYSCYDHNGNIMHFDHGTGDGPGYGSFRTYTTASSEAWEPTNSYSTIRTDDNPSSNGGSYGNSTCASGYLGHYAHSPVGTKAHYGGMPRGFRGQEDDLAYAFRDVGIIVNETSQDYALFNRYENNDRGYFLPTARSAMLYLGSHIRNQDRSGWAQYNSRRHDGSNWTDGWYSGHGSFCYNKKLNKMVMMESNGSHTHRYALWSNVPDLRAYANESTEIWNADNYSHQQKSRGDDVLTAYFNDPANKSYPYEEYNYNQQNDSWQNDSETNYRTQIILCDNERLIEITNGHNTGLNLTRWFGPNDGADAYKSMNSSGNAESHRWTRKWHPVGWPHYNALDQGRRYGARWHVSSDGRYVWCYAPEYYYHAGYHLYVIRVSDGKFVYDYRSDSTHGWTFCPMGKSGMFMTVGWNTDSGQGAYTKTNNLDDIFGRAQNDNNRYDFWSGHTGYWLEAGGSYSTAYLHCVPQIYDTSLFSEPQIEDIE